MHFFLFSSSAVRSSKFVDTDVWLHDAERTARAAPVVAADTEALDAATRNDDDDVDVAAAADGGPRPPLPPRQPRRMPAATSRPYLSPTSSDLGVLAWRK
jgi:hypothetical protein